MNFDDIDINSLPELSEKINQDLKNLFSRLKKNKKKELDTLFHRLHNEAFENYNCLECGNCCKRLGPRIIEKDIDNISKKLKIKTKDFIDTYLKIDEDRDFVFKSMPCPFIGIDNYCFIYENRPKACYDYPHTNRNKIFKILDIILKNNTICPISYWISVKMLEKYK